MKSKKQKKGSKRGKKNHRRTASEIGQRSDVQAQNTEQYEEQKDF